MWKTPWELKKNEVKAAIKATHYEIWKHTSFIVLLRVGIKILLIKNCKPYIEGNLLENNPIMDF